MFEYLTSLRIRCTQFIGCGVIGNRIALNLLLIVLMSLAGSATQAAQPPACPGGDSPTYPSFASPGRAPSVSSWRKLATIVSNCHVALQSPAYLTVAIAASFEFNGNIEEIAQRIGAISQSRRLVYWSITNKSWQSLVDEAFALETNDSDTQRVDFSAFEILSGDGLYFAQNDWQSWGRNVFSYETLESSADHIVIKSQNKSSIRFGPITMLKPDDAVSVLFVNRVKDDLWTYYSLALVKNATLPIDKKSIINRQAALYRNFVGERLDKEPPLAR